MSTETITLNVQARQNGKGQSRNLRNQKLIPAIVYGQKVDNASVSIDELSVERYSAQGFDNEIFELKSEDKNLNGLSVIMKDVDVHPVTRRPMHVDFYALDMTAKIKVDVEVNLNGKPKGVTESGGVLQIIARNVEVECLPKDIPSSIEVDISGLDINQTLHVSNLQLPNGVVAVTAGELAIANVTAPAAEKADSEDEAAATAEAPKE